MCRTCAAQQCRSVSRMSNRWSSENRKWNQALMAVSSATQRKSLTRQRGERPEVIRRSSAIVHARAVNVPSPAARSCDDVQSQTTLATTDDERCWRRVRCVESLQLVDDADHGVYVTLGAARRRCRASSQSSSPVESRLDGSSTCHNSRRQSASRYID